MLYSQGQSLICVLDCLEYFCDVSVYCTFVSHESVLSRCSFWLNIQTAKPPASTTEAKEELPGRPPRPGPNPSPPPVPPALEFGLDTEGAVTVLPVPPLPDSSESEPLRLELDLRLLNVQQLLLQAAAHHAVVQLGRLPRTISCSVKAALPSQHQHSNGITVRSHSHHNDTML